MGLHCRHIRLASLLSRYSTEFKCNFVQYRVRVAESFLKKKKKKIKKNKKNKKLKNLKNF